MVLPVKNPAPSALRIVVPGLPVAWARPRVGRGGRGPAGVFSVFTPEKQRNWRHLAQSYMQQAMAGCALLEGPLAVVVDAVWPRPASLPKKAPQGRVPRLSRPDCDNLLKHVLDGGIGILYADDAIVWDGRVRKWVAAAGEGPCVEILVTQVGATS